jgi:hypothetical protein
LGILLGLLAFAAVYFIYEFATLRDFGEVKKGIRALPIAAGLTLAAALIPLTGGFGYAGRIPDEGQIEAIYVSEPINDNVLFSGDSYGWASVAAGRFITPGDVKTILSLHGDFIKSKAPFNKSPNYSMLWDDVFYIRYNLKDGSSIIRAYRVRADKLKDLAAAVCDTDYCREYMTSLLTDTDKQKDTAIEAYYSTDLMPGDYWFNSPRYYISDIFTNNEWRKQEKIGVSFREDNRSMAVLLPKDMVSVEPVSLGDMLDAEKFRELKRCVLDDYLEMGTRERLFGETDVQGLIVFDSIDILPVFDDGDDYDAGYYNYFYGSARPASIAVTSQMKRTLAFLEENDLTCFFKAEDRPVFAAVCADPGYIEYYKHDAYLPVATWRQENRLYYMAAFYYDIGSETTPWAAIYEEAGVETYTDPGEIEALLEKALPMALGKEGKMVHFVYENRRHSIMYLPE